MGLGCETIRLAGDLAKATLDLRFMKDFNFPPGRWL